MCEELNIPISYSRIAKTNIDAPMENKKSAYQYSKRQDQSLETGQLVATGHQNDQTDYL